MKQKIIEEMNLQSKIYHDPKTTPEQKKEAKEKWYKLVKDFSNLISSSSLSKNEES